MDPTALCLQAEVGMRDNEVLLERVVCFSVAVLDICEALPNTRSGNHVAGQLLRSGTGSASNYAEAREAESRKDFVHKLKVAMKELS